MGTRTIAIWFSAVVVLAVLTIVFIPRSLVPQQVSTQTSWSTQDWLSGTPKEQGLEPRDVKT